MFGNQKKRPLFNKRIILPAILLFLFLLILNIPWLFLLVIIFTLTIYASRQLKRNYVIDIIFTAFSVLLCVVLIRMFAFDLYKVPSDSMENSFFINDRLIINKLSYGPKLPGDAQDIPWLGMLFKDKGKWPQVRLSGISKVKTNDIIVFRNSADPRKFMVKRCIGLPGEKLVMSNDTLFIDGRFIKSPESVKNMYNIIVKQTQAFIAYAKQHRIAFSLNENRSIDAFLTADQKGGIQCLNGFEQIRYIRIGWGFFSEKGKTSKWDNPLKHWTVDRFGPLLIPKKGTTIHLDAQNLFLYSGIIFSEDKTVMLSGSRLYRYGMLIDNYTFENNYFFFLGDNRHQSYDSRYWGFVSEKQIEGKVLLSLSVGKS
ncbi:signal peptidase I [Pedobacter miscanthi]|uniref:Signal peptidase I n=1 Tax=Pedobacter miscanthi TaxID=2259170 RepID=A0A366KLX8_9SPHI|nr:signal peptidase I [Pedobacter miscanthi]RBQ02707.1 signal peptidase I [Pedobacter miscanthi]